MSCFRSFRDPTVITPTGIGGSTGRVCCSFAVVAFLTVTFSALAHATTISGTLTSGSPTMTGRIFRNAAEATCAVSKPYPGDTDTGSTFRYATHTVVVGPAGCLSFKVIMAGSCQAHLSIYSPTFTPTDRSANFLGDPGTGDPGNEMSVSVATGQTLILVVSASNTTASDCSYSFLAGVTPAAHEFTGDGRSDLVWRQNGTGATALWRMNGATIINPTFIAGNCPDQLVDRGPTGFRWQCERRSVVA